MIKLLIIADDFTGALDTGVQFAACGASTRVVTDSGYDMSQVDSSVEVLVMNAETRHLTGREAYEKVYKVVKKACENDITYIYKKTDSAMRGNIGSELEAVLDGAKGDVLHFLPAFPKMRRVTKNGFHYIDNLPVHESVFGKDLYEPVANSYIPDIIHQQSSVRVDILPGVRCPENEQGPVIRLYDVEKDEDIEKIAKDLQNNNQLRLMAGCAGFAAALPKLLKLEGGKPLAPDFKKQFLIVCGSVNPITKNQLNYAEKHGFSRIRLTPWQKLKEGYFDTGAGRADLTVWKDKILNSAACILDTNDVRGNHETVKYAEKNGICQKELRRRIAANLGRAVKMLIESGIDSTLLITGGDTLMGFMEQARIREITPVCEMAPGTVLSQIQIHNQSCGVISKSGGFGKEELLVTLAEEILKEKEGSA